MTVKTDDNKKVEKHLPRTNLAPTKNRGAIVQGKQLGYDHRIIEKKWRRIWSETGLYSPDFKKSTKKFYKRSLQNGKPFYNRSLQNGKPFYNLWMFPYPSAEGVHMGTIFSSTGSDVYGRFKRMNGYSVFQPIGFDSFGIHSENYALKIDENPKDTLKRTLPHFAEQFKMVGHEYDWTRTVTTSDPDYYRWTQWLFVQMFKAGLAYKKKAQVNWCPSCKTVLADEQVVTPAQAGKEPKNAKGEVIVNDAVLPADWRVCERCGTLVEKRDLEQWFFKITDYADKLLEGLEKINWPEKIKTAQRNWIGKSEGALIKFPVPNHNFEIEVFTTRPDTIYGATFLVVSPIYAKKYLLNYISFETKDSLTKYIDKHLSDQKEDLTLGKELNKEKTGINTHLTAVNPATNQNIPIFVSDYVLDEYGTGAIMAVPAHDERDFAFAKSFDLSVVKVIDQNIETHALLIKRSVREDFVEEVKKNGWYITDYQNWGYGVVVPKADDKKFIQMVQEYLKNEPWYVHSDGSSKVVIFKDKVFDMQTENDQAKDYARKLSIPEEQIDWDIKTNYLFCHDKPGKLVDSGRWNGFEYPKDFNKILFDIEKKGWGYRKSQYHLRDWLISRQRYWGPPIPMIFCSNCKSKGKSWFNGRVEKRESGSVEGGSVIASEAKQSQKYKTWDSAGYYPVPEPDLPVLLPDIRDFKPEGTGKGPLAKHPEFYETKCPGCAEKAVRETDVSDTFLDSAWYFLRYTSVGEKSSELEIGNWKLEIPWNREITRSWLPVDLYFGGAEHAVLHLMYARFVWKMLIDSGFVDKKLGYEPFPWFYAHGLMIKDGAKMSKSRGNVVNPDEYIEKFGADTLRLYLMFMGPMDGYPDFRDTGIEGMRKFVERIWTLFGDSNLITKNQEIAVKMHQTIKKVTEDMNEFKYNTAISAIMEYVNTLRASISNTQIPNSKRSEKSAIQKSSTKSDDSRKYFETLILLLAPFTPHLAEELWQRLGIRHKALGIRRKQNTSSYKFVISDSVHTQLWPSYDPKMVIEEKVVIPVQINGKLRATIEVDREKENDKEYVLSVSKANAKVQKWLAGKEIKKEIYIQGRLVNFVV